MTDAGTAYSNAYWRAARRGAGLPLEELHAAHRAARVQVQLLELALSHAQGRTAGLQDAVAERHAAGERL